MNLRASMNSAKTSSAFRVCPLLRIRPAARLFIKTATVTPSLRVAAPEYNAERIVELAREAAEGGAKLIVFPELAVTAYTCGDLFLQTSILERAEAALLEIAEKTARLDALIVVGFPLSAGGSLYNTAAFVSDGEILGFVPKTHIPTHTEFYEGRHFATAPECTVDISFQGKTVPFGTKLIFCAEDMPSFAVACELCEDLWVAESPAARHVKNGAVIVVNLSASDEIVGKSDFRRSLLIAQSSKLLCGYIYAGAGEDESSTDLVFSGHSLIYENGKKLAERPLFTTGIIYGDIDVNRLMNERRRTTTFKNEFDGGYRRVYFNVKIEENKLSRTFERHPFVPSDKRSLTERCESIFAMQYMGLVKRIKHIGLKTVTIGISGGLDSTLALLVAARAFDRLGLDRKGIIAVTMPAFGTTDRTRNNALELIDCVGAAAREIPIGEAVSLHLRDMGASEEEHDAAYENAQARERTQILMDIANKMGGIVVGTGDLSELALGWATYNGDHMSMYGVNSGVPKTLVRHLVSYVADTSDERLRAVLRDILDTPVSPELIPPEDGEIVQKTEDIIGPYELHDFFLYHMVRNGFTRKKIKRLALCAFEDEYSEEEIEKWLGVFMRRFFSNQFKRSALPDGPKVGTVNLSPRGDWRMPSDADGSGF